jgi:hypothetical protein
MCGVTRAPREPPNTTSCTRVVSVNGKLPGTATSEWRNTANDKLY